MLSEQRERLLGSEGYIDYKAKMDATPPTPTDEQRDCPACRGTGWLRSSAQPGEEGFGQLSACDCQKAILAAARQNRLAELCNLNPQEQELTLDQFAARGTGSATDEIVRRVRQFAVAPTGFITLWGGPGNGKSLALMALANHFRQQGKVSVYTPLADLVEWVRAGYAPDAGQSAEQRYQLVRSAYFLAIDETEKVSHETPWYETLRTRLLDQRHRDARERLTCTAIALNDSPFETLPAHLLSRLRDANFAVEVDRDGIGIPAIYQNTDSDMRPFAAVPMDQLLEKGE